MARKTQKKQEPDTNENIEFIEALEAIEKEKDISKEVLLEAIENSLVAACKDQFSDAENVRVDINRDTGEFHVYIAKTIVDEVEDEALEISLEKAKETNPDAKVGDEDLSEVTPKNFGRIATQKAKQVVVQKIREEEKRIIYDQYYTKERDLITGTVQRYNANQESYTINIGKIDVLLTPQEQVDTEFFRVHEHIKVYVKEVRDTKKGMRVIISRKDRGLVRKLFENEVTEIQDGVVEIKSVSREEGSRSKIAVYSNDPDVDAVGACVGINGVRVNAVVDELRGEKIDIIEWSEDPDIFIENALSPSKVVRVDADPEEKTAEVIVPDYQLSLAIGKEGQNARLAAKLTGYKIDIKSESQI